MAQLLSNAQLARNGNIELMEDVNSGLREIDKTNEILKELAAQQRGRERRLHQSNTNNTE
jgi:hypothetical protein